MQNFIAKKCAAVYTLRRCFCNQYPYSQIYHRAAIGIYKNRYFTVFLP